MSPRLVACLTLLVALGCGSVQAAPVDQKPTGTTEVAPEKKSDWTAADYKASRDRDDERQKTWDRKMKALTGSICSGC
jgi:hypothetical protein